MAFQQGLFRQAYLQIQAAGLPAPDRVTHDWRKRVEAQLPGIVQNLRAALWQTTQRAAAAAYAGGFWGKAWQLNQVTSTKLAVRATPRVTTPKQREDVYDEIIAAHLREEWFDLYSANLETMVGAIKTAIWTSVAQGETFAQTMRRVATAMGITDRRSYRAAFNRIQALTRMVIARSLNEAAWELFTQNSPIVTQYEWLTARDERVCPVCWGLDGTRYESGEAWFNLPPAHQNCRCDVVPVARFEWMFGGELHTEKSFVNWLREQGYDLSAVMERYLNANPGWLSD